MSSPTEHGPTATNAAVADLLGLLSAGRLAVATADLERHDLDPWSRALLEHDLAVRRSGIGVAALDDLRAGIDAHEAPGSPRWAWVRAVMAERLLFDYDPAGLVLAVATLAELPADPIGPVSLVYARARLVRVASAGWIMHPTPDGLHHHRTMRDEAVRLLGRCGFAAEVSATVGLAAGMQALVFNDDLPAGIDALVTARAAFDDTEPTIWLPAIDHLIAGLALAAEDLDEAEEAWIRLERSPVHLPRLATFPAFGRALRDVLTGADGAAARLDASLGAVQADPVLQPLHRRAAAHALCDVGHPDAVRHAHAATAFPVLGPIDALDREALARRIDLLEGRDVATDGLHRPLDALVAAGRRRVAARLALTFAGDLRRAGRIEDAAKLAAWADDHLPASTARTAAEERLLRRVGPGTARAVGAEVPDPPAAVDARCTVRVLDARFAVEVDGTAVPLGTLPTLLLIALVLAHPAPLHSERVSQRLWPDEPYRRSRVNTVVYRLRRGLGPAGTAVRRHGDGFVLDDHLVDVDLWHHRTAMAGTPAQRAAAVTRVRGVFAGAELPYDEALTDARAQFVAGWTAQARALLDAGALTLADLGDALAALERSPADLGGPA